MTNDDHEAALFQLVESRACGLLRDGPCRLRGDPDRSRKDEKMAYFHRRFSFAAS